MKHTRLRSLVRSSPVLKIVKIGKLNFEKKNAKIDRPAAVVRPECDT